MEDIENLVKELIEGDIILVDESKENLLVTIIKGVYWRGKSDYEKEVRQEFKEKVENILKDI